MFYLYFPYFSGIKIKALKCELWQSIQLQQETWKHIGFLCMMKCSLTDWTGCTNTESVLVSQNSQDLHRFFQLLRGHILDIICNHEIHNTHYCQWGMTVSVSLYETENLQMVSHYSFQNLNKLLSWRGRVRARAAQIALTWLFKILNRAVSDAH